MHGNGTRHHWPTQTLALLAMGMGLLFSFDPSYGAEKKLVPFQARLTNDDGQPPPSDVYRITFAIYDAPTGGSALWTEVHDSVSIMSGQLNILLGSITSLDDPKATGNPADAIKFDRPRYLGITVGDRSNPNLPTQEMVPRHQLVPAFHARTADHATDADNATTVIDGAITSAKLADASVTGTKLVDSSVTGAKLVDSSVSGTKLTDGSVNSAKLSGTLRNTLTNTSSPRNVVAATINCNFTPCSVDRTTGGIASASIGTAFGRPVMNVTFTAGQFVNNGVLCVVNGGAALAQAFCRGHNAAAGGVTVECFDTAGTGVQPGIVDFICVGPS